MPFVANKDIYELVKFTGPPNPDDLLVVEAEDGVELVFKAGFHRYPSWKSLVLMPDLSIGLDDDASDLTEYRDQVIAEQLLIGSRGLLCRLTTLGDYATTPIITGWRAATVQELQESRRCGQ